MIKEDTKILGCVIFFVAMFVTLLWTNKSIQNSKTNEVKAQALTNLTRYEITCGDESFERSLIKDKNTYYDKDGNIIIDIDDCMVVKDEYGSTIMSSTNFSIKEKGE